MKLLIYSSLTTIISIITLKQYFKLNKEISDLKKDIYELNKKIEDIEHSSYFSEYKSLESSTMSDHEKNLQNWKIKN